MFLAVFLSPFGVAPHELRAEDPAWIAAGANGMVAADSPYASQAGLDILQAGGNAVDAAVAVSFALAVTRPESTGLGGGGFMIARFADGRIVVQDFRESAPAGADQGMYVRKESEPSDQPPASQIGYAAVAVPGLVAGRCQALSQYGTIPLSQAIAPAIRLAEGGFPVDEHYVDATRKVLAHYVQYPDLKASCGYVYTTHLREGKLRAVGEMLVQPALAKLLRRIAQSGPECFYHGPVASALAEQMRKDGGYITEKDLASYRVMERDPIRSTYREFEIIGMPPPSSGGVTLAETLNILEAVDYAKLAKTDVDLALHYQIEAMKHAFADRARWLADADFADVPVARLSAKRYAQRLADRLMPGRVADPDAYGSSVFIEDAGTSHFCVADRWGNVVVSTETVNTEFGSLTAVAEWGLILNNEMDDFVTEPGKPNAYGLVQSDRNAIEPGKRPLSSMAPMIVLRDGEPYLLLGASGGPRIISSVLNVLLAVTDYGLPLNQAMLEQRPHHQWRPDEVFFDASPSEAARMALQQRGHRVADRRKTGVVQAILRTNDGWIGACDPRKGGRPAGY